MFSPLTFGLEFMKSLEHYFLVVGKSYFCPERYDWLGMWAL